MSPGFERALAFAISYKYTYMTKPIDAIESIVDRLAAIGGVMREDIDIDEDTVTAYVPADQLNFVKQLEGIDIEVIEQYEHEHLISATASR